MAETTSIKKIDVRGVMFDDVTMQTALNKATELTEKDGFDYIFTPNSEIVQNCIENKELYHVINSASMIIPDGIGVVYASKILGRPLTEKVGGFELSKRLIEYAAKNGKKMFFFGSSPAKDGEKSVSDKAAENLVAKYPELLVCGTRDGYFSENDVPEIIEQINNSGADILFVCLGAPKQEKWIYENRQKLNVSLALGLGGSLDIYAGTAKHAPVIFRKLNLEWFYRLLKQPSRIGRMMSLPKFLFGTIFFKLSGKDKK